MNINKLAAIWCNGDLPFRPQWLAKEFVLRCVCKNPARAAMLALDLERSHGPNVGYCFAVHLEQYQESAWKWRYHMITQSPKPRASSRGARQHNPLPSVKVVGHPP